MNISKELISQSTAEELRVLQEQAIASGRHIMEHVGLEPEYRQSKGKVPGGGGIFRVRGWAFTVRQSSKPISLGETDRNEPKYTRILDFKDLWYARRQVPMFLGDLALNETPHITGGGLHVINYPVAIEDADVSDQGEISSSVPHPEFITIRPEDNNLFAGLENFFSDMQTISNALGMSLGSEVSTE
jgi:hypothetical protein